jgi:hypothetical protein
LNRPETAVDRPKPEEDKSVQGSQGDTTDGRWKVGFKNWRPRRRNPPVDEESAVSEVKGEDTQSKKFARLGKFSEWKFRKGRSEGEVESQQGVVGKEDNDKEEGSGFVGFRKIRNFKFKRDRKEEENRS